MGEYFASNTIEIELDEELLSKNDEVYFRYKKLYLFFNFMIVFYAVLFFCSIFFKFAWIIILIIPFCFFTFAFRSGIKELLEEYLGRIEDGCLSAGIIVNTKPIMLLVYTDVSTYGEPIHAFKKIRIKKLPLHNIKVGEKVPVITHYTLLKKEYIIIYLFTHLAGVIIISKKLIVK